MNPENSIKDEAAQNNADNDMKSETEATDNADKNSFPDTIDSIEAGLKSVTSLSADQDGISTTKKYIGRCRLFFGNLPKALTQDEFKELLKPFGDHLNLFLNANKGYGFVKLETRAAAEFCKARLDGALYADRPIRVRFATHSAALLVKHLPKFCTNELLHLAFSQFGEVERAVVVVDERGKLTGNGIVEFEKKQSYNQAIDAIAGGVFYITRTLRPIEVEPLEQKDEEDGMQQRYAPTTEESELELGLAPRFADPDSYEHEIGMRWKRLDQIEREKRHHLEEEMAGLRLELHIEISSIITEEKASKIKADLQLRQAELDALEAEQLSKRKELEALRKATPTKPPIISFAAIMSQDRQKKIESQIKPFVSALVQRNPSDGKAKSGPTASTTSSPGPTASTTPKSSVTPVKHSTSAIVVKPLTTSAIVVKPLNSTAAVKTSAAGDKPVGGSKVEIKPKTAAQEAKPGATISTLPSLKRAASTIAKTRPATSSSGPGKPIKTTANNGVIVKHFVGGPKPAGNPSNQGHTKGPQAAQNQNQTALQTLQRTLHQAHNQLQQQQRIQQHQQHYQQHQQQRYQQPQQFQRQQQPQPYQRQQQFQQQSSARNNLQLPNRQVQGGILPPPQPPAHLMRNQNSNITLSGGGGGNNNSVTGGRIPLLGSSGNTRGNAASNTMRGGSHQIQPLIQRPALLSQPRQVINLMQQRMTMTQGPPNKRFRQF